MHTQRRPRVSPSLCRQGRYNLDPGVRFFATPPVHGSLCRYVDHPEDFCHEMPDGMDYEEGALIEPLANALFACMRARVGPGKSVAILGAGTMGESVREVEEGCNFHTHGSQACCDLCSHFMLTSFFENPLWGCGKYFQSGSWEIAQSQYAKVPGCDCDQFKTFCFAVIFAAVKADVCICFLPYPIGDLNNVLSSLIASAFTMSLIGRPAQPGVLQSIGCHQNCHH